MPQLIFYIESGYPQIHNLLTRKASVGRNEDNDIHLNDPRVSPFHAELVRNGEGFYQLNDLNSDNGTAVNGKLIDEKILGGGDQIKFGSVNAAFVDQSETPEDKLLRQAAEKDLESKAEKLAKIEETIEARTVIQNAIEDGTSKLEELENSVRQLEQRSESERNNLNAIQSELENFRLRRTDLQSELKVQEKELEELGKDRANLQQQHKRVHTANENSERLKEELDVELENLRQKIGEEKSALEGLMRAHQEAKAVIEEAGTIRANMDEFEQGLKRLEVSYEEFGRKTAAREATFEKLGEDIAERNGALEELVQTLESKRSEIEELSREIQKNNELILSSSELLVRMDTTLKNEIDEVSRSQETQNSLNRESRSLSHLINGKTAVLNRLTDKFDARKNGEIEVISCPPLRVINPTMRSLVHYFQHGAGIPDQDRVNPIGYDGLAACTRGSMHRDADTIPAGDDPVLILLHGDFDKDRTLIESISREMPNSVLLVNWREDQLDAIALEQECAPDSLQIPDLLEGVDGIVSVDARTAELIDSLKVGLPHLNVPLPCPVELPDWNRPVSTSKRPREVFVSADGFDPNLPLHLGRLDLLNQFVAETQANVTLYNPIPDMMERLTIPHQLITNIEAPLKYGERLAIMREHHFVTGFGKNRDGGEVLGDAILSKTILMGADFNSVMDQLLFPDFCIKGDDIERSFKKATKLISDQGAFLETLDQSQSLAVELISFETVNERLGEFLQTIPANLVEMANSA